MPSALPVGDPAPPDGRLPESALASLGSTPLGVYLHVPFCAARCGYCDFTTYTAAELGGRPGTDPASYVEAALVEIALAKKVLGNAAPPASTVFVGGGTPTLLGSAALTRLLRAVEQTFGLMPGAEVTTEANPESVDAASLSALGRSGFTRVSFGMQSAVPHVLAALDRRHRPGRPENCVAWARAAGFEHVSLDLIYGAPGESDTDWARSLDAVVGCGVDHVSAYALVVEAGTRLARQVASGEVEAPDDDVLARRYELADVALSGVAMAWYEVSNWAHLGGECRHNLGYWRGHNWWGIGPGAHSHVGGVRWWNGKHPAAYVARLAEGRSPAAGREVVGPAARELERVLLGVRLREGLPLAGLPAGRVAATLADGLLDQAAYAAGRAVLTLRGRLLADRVVDLLTA